MQGGKRLTKLSEQMMISCEPSKNGGQDSDVLWGWLKENTGGRLETDASYPGGYNRTCNFFREQLLAPDGTAWFIKFVWAIYYCSLCSIYLNSSVCFFSFSNKVWRLDIYFTKFWLSSTFSLRNCSLAESRAELWMTYWVGGTTCWAEGWGWRIAGGYLMVS